MRLLCNRGKKGLSYYIEDHSQYIDLLGYKMVMRYRTIVISNIFNAQPMSNASKCTLVHRRKCKKMRGTKRYNAYNRTDKILKLKIIKYLIILWKKNQLKRKKNPFTVSFYYKVSYFTPKYKVISLFHLIIYI